MSYSENRESSNRKGKKPSKDTVSKVPSPELVVTTSKHSGSNLSESEQKSEIIIAPAKSLPQVPKQCSGCEYLHPPQSISDFRCHSAVFGFLKIHDKKEIYRTVNMAHELPLFPKAFSMYLHSGNMINWARLKKKPNMSSSEEICEVITETLSSYLDTANKTELQYVTEIYKVNAEKVEPIEENERGDVKITVKIIICNTDSTSATSTIHDAISKVLNELGTSFIETLLLAVSPVESDDQEAEAVSLETIQTYWVAMEELVAKDKVLSLGVCDLGKDGLEALYNWAQIKPTVDQINLESCCVLPKDLTEYAKSVNIQLLTHNDSPAFITKDVLQEKIQSKTTERDSDAWSPEWVVRYSGIIKCRGIVKMKGYIFHATRDNKKRIY